MNSNLPNAHRFAVAKTLLCAIACASMLSLSACGKKAAEPTTAERLKIITQNQATLSKAETNADAPKTAASNSTSATPITK